MKHKSKKIVYLSYNAAYYLELLQRLSGLSAVEIIRQLIIETGEKVDHPEHFIAGYFPLDGENTRGSTFNEILGEAEGGDLGPEQYAQSIGDALRRACCTRSRIGRPNALGGDAVPLEAARVEVAEGAVDQVVINTGIKRGPEKG